MTVGTSPWTPELVERCKAMKLGGMTARAISEVVGLSRNAVHKKLYTVGVRQDARPRWTDAQKAQLRELWATPMESAAIGVFMGFTSKAIRSQARVLNLPKRRNGSHERRPILKTRPIKTLADQSSLPGLISAPFSGVALLTEPKSKALPPLRGRILDQLATRPSDTLNLSSACEAKEMLVSQTLAVLESEGVVVWTPATGPRAKVWSLAERIAA